jgi:hypothetical protein
MPESRETYASGKVAEHRLALAKAAGANLTLEDIVCDATGTEAESADAPERAKGLPYALAPSSPILRGSNKHQTSVYPLSLRVSSDTPSRPLSVVWFCEALKPHTVL